MYYYIKNILDQIIKQFIYKHPEKNAIVRN